MVQNSRKVRGRRTEHIVANYFARVWGSAQVIARLGDMMPLLEDKVPSDAIIRCKGCGTWTTDGKPCEVCEVIKNNA